MVLPFVATLARLQGAVNLFVDAFVAVNRGIATLCDLEVYATLLFLFLPRFTL